VPNTQWGKDGLFNKGYWEKMDIHKQKKLDSYFAPFIKTQVKME
jgi:hypothetical protein